MNVFRKVPLLAAICAMASIGLDVTAAYASGDARVPVQVKQHPHPSIAESGRLEVARLAGFDANRSVLPPNYPQSFAGPIPVSRFGRKIVAGTAFAIGGSLAGALAGVAIANAGGCRGECSMTGLAIGIPVGAISAAVAGIALTN